MPGWACLCSWSEVGPAGGKRCGQEMVVVDTWWLICSTGIEINKCALNLYKGVSALQNRTMKGNSELAFEWVLMSLVTRTGIVCPEFGRYVRLMPPVHRNMCAYGSCVPCHI